MNNEFASFEKMPASVPERPTDEINTEQIEEIAIVGEQQDDTPIETYQGRGIKVEAAINDQPVTENLEVPDLAEALETAKAESSAEEHQQAILDEILQAHETISPEPQSTNAENQNGLKDRLVETINKAKKNINLKIAVGALAVLCLVPALTACSGNQVANNNQEPTTAYEQTTAAGEQENGLKYDYSAYNSPEKLNKNNFGEDLRKYHGNRDAMVEAMMKDSNNNPEMLVSEAYNILTPSQKRDIGIENMNMDEIDEALNGENGEELRQKMFNSLNNVMNNEETDIEFVTSNGRAWTLTEYTVDKNNDGKQTPDETYIGTAKTYRHNVKQFVVTNESDGEKTVTIINEYCGLQADTKDRPEGLKEVDPDESIKPPETTTKSTPETTTEPATETTTEWGKSGDPHGGENVTRSPQVDPNSQKSKEENDNTNKGNQGSSNTKPGSSSNNTNSNNKPTNPNRKSGGENQGGSSTNGNNSAPKGNESREQSGNNSQRQAQEQNQPGGDNNANSEEEQRVADGDF